MTWLDYWPLPWLLYSAVSLRILGLACLAVIAVAFSSFGSEKAHPVGEVGAQELELGPH